MKVPVALGGWSLAEFQTGGYASGWLRSLGLMDYCGIDDGRLELIADRLDDNARFDLIIQRAGEPGRDFGA